MVTQRRKQLILKGDVGAGAHRVVGIGVEPGTSLEGRSEEKATFLGQSKQHVQRDTRGQVKSRRLCFGERTQFDHSSLSLAR